MTIPASVFAVAVPILVLLLALRLILGSGRLTPFSWLRAQTSIHSLRGENLAAVLAIVSVTQLLLTASELPVPPDWAVGVGRTAVALAVLALIGIVVTPRTTAAVLAAVGIGAAAVDTYYRHGPDIAGVLAAAALALLWLLGLARGFLRPG